MITKDEFDYVRKVLKEALAKGAPLAPKDGGGNLAVVDVDAVIRELDACWDALVPPAYREGE